MTLDEILNFNAPYNKNTLDSIIGKIQHDDIVPYVGAGMSMLADGVFPTWNSFLQNTATKYGVQPDRFEGLTLEEKAEFLSEKLGSVTFPEHLVKVFSSIYLDEKVIDFERAAVYQIPRIFNKGLLLTTNYDEVLEKVYALYGKGLPQTYPGHFEMLHRSMREGALTLFKIHGTVNEPQTSIILSKSQYEKAYANPDLAATLKKVYSSKSILFLGCSLGLDRPLALLKGEIASGIRHFAITSASDEDKEQRRLALERDFAVQSILYPEGAHDCVATLLAHIANQMHAPVLQKSSELTSFGTELNTQWFQNQNDIQISNLGNRYLPEYKRQPKSEPCAREILSHLRS